jgi:hypothetical protein
MVLQIIEELDWEIVLEVNIQMAFQADVILLYPKNKA